jgi:hypothetical protein
MDNLFDKDHDLSDGEVNFFYLGVFVVFFGIIVFVQPQTLSGPRWGVGWDLNNDGYFTANDLFLWFIWVFSMPGDIVVHFSMKSSFMRRFFELTPYSYGNAVSVTFSLLYWWLIGGKRWVMFWLSVVIISMWQTLPPLPLNR